MTTNILFVHGILGHPSYFDFLLPYIPSGFRTSKILLAGHGGSTKDFANASMAQWRAQVREDAESLKQGNDRLIIVAHSMGTLFAIDNAVKGRADGLFLLNPPLSLRATRRLFTNPLKVLTGNINDHWTKAAKEAYSIADDSNPLHYLGWIPRYLELFTEISRTRKTVGQLTAPTRVFLSAHDEMISPKAARFFPAGEGISIATLPDSGHYYYPEPDRDTICRSFAEFLSRFK